MSVMWRRVSVDGVVWVEYETIASWVNTANLRIRVATMCLIWMHGWLWVVSVDRFVECACAHVSEVGWYTIFRL